MKFSLLLKITIYRFDLKKMVIPVNYEVSTFTLVHHSFLIKCWGLEIDRNRRHSFAGRHFGLLKTKVNERHLARFCIATLGKVWIQTQAFSESSKFWSWLFPRLVPANTNTLIQQRIKQAQLSAGRNSNLSCGTRGKIGHQINRCVIFWRQFFN